MLELAHKLADCDESFFGGWVLAGAEAHIHGRAQLLENRVLLCKKRSCVMQVLGRTESGATAKELRVFLVLPRERLESGAATAGEPAGRLAASHCFTAQEVQEYVSLTGDDNILHKGKRPIVPGLCMAAWLQRQLELSELDWRISFLAPVYAGELLQVYSSPRELQAYVGAARVFVIKF